MYPTSKCEGSSPEFPADIHVCHAAWILARFTGYHRAISEATIANNLQRNGCKDARRLLQEGIIPFFVASSFNGCLFGPDASDLARCLARCPPRCGRKPDAANLRRSCVQEGANLCPKRRAKRANKGKHVTSQTRRQDACRVGRPSLPLRGACVTGAADARDRQHFHWWGSVVIRRTPV